ncbi:polysaccharide deacetylase family protein [Solimicrobium silvestre]|uniref:polysaccharide deacetylase family protein n=1 Tax=Solimicrobium silvestre TaxID=2099400 RepID=UPI001FAF9CFE|nr:polysaccharide deacetylase family protein [Solimicrobium silvestre]
MFFLTITCCFSTACLANPASAELAESAAPATPAPIRFLLSFDDGPSGNKYNNSTEQVLEVLANNHVQAGIKALFFTQTRAVTGGGTAIGRKLMQREWNEGHLLGFHTATPHHSNHRFLSEPEFEQSLQDGIADLTEITGVAPKLVRPPFWNYDKRTFAAYQRHGMQVLLTDLSANDGKIWGVNFSFHKHSNMLKQLGELRAKWLAGKLPVVDGCTPIVVTFHDVNTYTSNHVEVYLEILVQVAAELEMPTTTIPFYTNRDELERAALTSAMHDTSIKPPLPGIWNWLWQ